MTKLTRNYVEPTKADIWKKYDGKTIRLVGEGYGKVYVIRVFEDSDNLNVQLDPKYGGATADNYVLFDSIEYQDGGPAFKAAVRKAKQIAEKIEEEEPTDFREHEEFGDLDEVSKYIKVEEDKK